MHFSSESLLGKMKISAGGPTLTKPNMYIDII